MANFVQSRTGPFAGRYARHSEPRRVTGILRRLSGGLVDQAVTSMVSFAVGIYVAHSLGAVRFGAFSLAWVTYGVCLNVSRGLATDPLAVRFSGVERSLWRSAVARSSGLALLVGLATGMSCVVAGLIIGGNPGEAFIALGIVLPGLLLQDSWRFAFFASGQGGRALTSDLVWAAALIPLLFLAAKRPSVTVFVLAWGSAAAVAAVVSCLQAAILPRITQAWSWLSAHRDLGPRYLAENVSLSGAAQLRAYGLGAIAGLAAVGQVRGAELLLGPFFMVLSGIGLVAVPEASRVLRRSVRALPVFCVALGGAQAVGALLWGLTLIVALPESIGVRLLGEVWPASSKLILPATIGVMFGSMTTGAAAGLRALGVARRSVKVQAVASSAYATFGIGGAFLGGALGSAWGVACAAGIGTLIWWWNLMAEMRNHR